MATPRHPKRILSMKFQGIVGKHLTHDFESTWASVARWERPLGLVMRRPGYQPSHQSVSTQGDTCL